MKGAGAAYSVPDADDVSGAVVAVGAPLRKQPLASHLNNDARRVARQQGGKRQQAEAMFTKPVTEREVVERIVQRADDELRYVPVLGSRPTGVLLRLSVFVVALFTALIPIMWRNAHGLPTYGGEERVNFCVDQWLPTQVTDMIGFEECAGAATADVIAMTPRVNVMSTGVSALLSMITDDTELGSTAGHVIVSGGLVWTIVLVYVLLMHLRFVLRRAYAHVVRWRLFSAISDPAEAVLQDVPYLNVRHAWQHWLRVRLYLLHMRRLELTWAEQTATHLLAGVAITWLVTLWSAYLAYSSP